MKLTVIGSTGRTGRLVVGEAARRGHRITAFTRRPQVLPEQPGVINVVHGDGRDAQDLRDAVTGADAVIAIVAAATRKGPHRPPRWPGSSPIRWPPWTSRG